MQILNDLLYILIEGEPNSPEVQFINRVIYKLISETILPNINFEVLEVGGSGNFNSLAKIIYRTSNLHKTIPVIAIADKDFRTQSQVDETVGKTDSKLIENKAARIIYWQKHEWENFLLDETETIASLFNQIPTKTSQDKPFRRNTTNTLTKEKLDEWLIQYFQTSIIQELVQCLKFRFREKSNLRFSLDNPTSLLLPDIKPWYRSQIASKARESKTNIIHLKSLLDDKLQEEFWQSCLNNPNTLDFAKAKRLFRGKEALERLCKQAAQHLLIENMSDKIFVQKILLPELEKNVDSPIVREINGMLNPYFERAANSRSAS
ncbi:hypothetical protein Cylst_1578 [Cylindrospermum stagnale PCC 7417]|uniref:DUF4435 domain-containing protein n=1 Tax=Cylindrospermum stagnale PCC 7417 TaxID=56107 RepID=K9WUH7_9NOST|nr:hypothetical protein [Cylindrospermum stagnale]AFZ23858.1 hypothetical protein Cylst_1578 [Cylindrospermum stagnale PCC 7417]